MKNVDLLERHAFEYRRTYILLLHSHELMLFILGDGFYLSPAPSPVYAHIWLYEQTHFFEFSVRSCERANVYLGEEPFASNKQRPGYEILLEGADSAVSELKRQYSLFTFLHNNNIFNLMV